MLLTSHEGGMKRHILALVLIIVLAGCGAKTVDNLIPITGRAVAETPSLMEEPFSGATFELTFGKTYKPSTFSAEGKVTRIMFERTFLPLKIGDKAIIRNRDAGREVIRIAKLGKKQEFNQQVFEREIQSEEEFAFIFKYPGNYQVICKVNGCIARIEVK